MNNFSDAFGGALRPGPKCDFKIIGIPFDLKSSYRRGAAGGPDAVRRVSTVRSISSYTESDIDLAEDVSVVDGGNIEVVEPVSSYFDTIENRIARTAEEGSIPVIIGGDHSVIYPVVRGLKHIYDEINIVWLDAHPDIYPEYEGDPYSHACPLARILELNGIRKVYQGGIRALNRDLKRRLAEASVNVADINNIDMLHGLSFVGKTYLTIDIDVLDPAFAPGVSNPVPGGISTRELLNLIMSFDLDIVGFDVVEINPERDVSDITAAAGVKIIMDTIGRIASLKQKK